MNHKAIILDTETHDLNGLVIQLAHAQLEFQSHKEKLVPVMQSHTLFNQLYSIGDVQINFAAMAIHNIIDSDLQGMPHTSSIRLPIQDGYIIGHNIDYDINAIKLSTQQDINLKPICTLALARMVWPELQAHTLSSLIYHIYGPTEFARSLVQDSHDAATDIRNTAHLISAICAALHVHSIEDLYQASCTARIPTVMPFGKHKGVAIENVPAPYMRWFIGTDNPDPYIAEAFKQCLNKKMPKKTQPKTKVLD